jgi:hypothetical protein
MAQPQGLLHAKLAPVRLVAVSDVVQLLAAYCTAAGCLLCKRVVAVVEQWPSFMCSAAILCSLLPTMVLPSLL